MPATTQGSGFKVGEKSLRKQKVHCEARSERVSQFGEMAFNSEVDPNVRLLNVNKTFHFNDFKCVRETF